MKLLISNHVWLHNQELELSATDSLTDGHFNYGLDFPTLRQAYHVHTADLETQLSIKSEEILTLRSESANLRCMLGTTEQEVFKLQSANKQLQLQLQTTKTSINYS